MSATANSAADTAPIAEWFQAHGAEIGPVGAIIAIQLFFLLIAVNGSPLIGVPLTAYTTIFTTELILSFIALFLLYGIPQTRRNLALRARTSILGGGSYGRFLMGYGVAMFLFLGLTSLLGPAGGASYSANGSSTLTSIVMYAVYVGPTETLLFVIAIPAALPKQLWWVGSGFIFALFHLPVDAATYGTGNLAELLYGFGFRFAFGAGIYLLYAGFALGSARRKVRVPGAGPGVAMSVHTFYDLWVAGALAPIPLALFHLSGVFTAFL